MTHRRRIVIGVTSDVSLRLLSGFPAFLAEEGWDVHVVCSPGPVLASTPEAKGVTFHALAMEREIALLADARALVQWVRLLRRLRPDVVTVGTPKAALLGGVAAWLARVPFRVYHQRGLRLETAAGLSRGVLSFTERLTAAASHVVVAVSPSLRDRLIHLGLVNSGKVVVLGSGSSNGVDLREFGSNRFDAESTAATGHATGLLPGVPAVGFVGRLSVDKGLRELAAAAAHLARSDVPFQLLVVGPSEDEASKAALEGIRRSGVHVVTTGPVADPAVYYQLMSVLCLPTHREGFPNVVLEAAAAERPTVTTNATGAVDAVVDGVTGLRVGVGDADALARALRRLLTDEEYTTELGQAARRRAESEFARADVWRAHAALFAHGPGRRTHER